MSGSNVLKRIFLNFLNIRLEIAQQFKATLELFNKDKSVEKLKSKQYNLNKFHCKTTEYTVCDR